MIAEPSADTLAWTAEQVGAGTRVDGWAALAGGTACAIHAVDVMDRSGLRHPVVLKRFFREDWLAREPDIVAREASHLRALDGLALPIPRLVGVDAEGLRCDHPAILMTRLPGRVELARDDLDGWLAALVEPLLVLHEIGDDVVGGLAGYRSYNDLGRLTPPTWSHDPDAWRQVLARVAEPAPDFVPRFVHRDYHPTNLLFCQGELSGVLDFTDASRGPAAADLGHCRLNLAQLHGPDVADRFLDIHQALAPGAIEIDPYWDALSLVEILPGPDEVYPGWRGPCSRGLSLQVVRERLDAYAHRLGARL